MSILEVKNISKRFGQNHANQNISFSLDKGEIIALLGENGAGKTTLMNILFGHYDADKGHIKIQGKKLENTTRAAIKAGIGMVHQHFTLADNLTVLENIILGTEKFSSLRQNLTAARKKLTAMSKELGLSIKLNAYVSKLSVGEKQRVEIIKVLYREAKVLILDEPTAVLTPQEVENLFQILKKLAEKGLAIIFISHKLHEILSITDRVIVLRRGQIAGIVNTADADVNLLGEMMVGKKVVRPKPEKMEVGKSVLNLDNVSLKSADQELKNLNINIRENEILGIAGVSGNGQSLLARFLSGQEKNFHGTLTLQNQVIQKPNPLYMVRNGVARIPEDRHSEGIIGDMLVWENLISENLNARNMTRWRFFINRESAFKYSEKLIANYDVRCSGYKEQSGLLSGGNIQKLILARTLSSQPKFILANQPVRGLDEGAIAYVQQQLLEARASGAAILLISEDLDELLALSDRMMVMYDGKLSESFEPASKSVSEIGLMMAGSHFTNNSAQSNNEN